MSLATKLQLSVSHSVMKVIDLDMMIAFYCDVLGFELMDRGPVLGQEIAFLSQAANDHHQLALITGREEAGHSNSTHHNAYRSAATLDDLRELLKVLEAHPGVSGIMPLTHGNAWSIYFSDPENNGVEIFLDTPWHVQQPQAAPLDLTKSTDEIIAATKAAMENEPEFGDIKDFYARRAAYLAETRGY